jgi:hypothetical protein
LKKLCNMLLQYFFQLLHKEVLAFYQWHCSFVLQIEVTDNFSHRYRQGLIRLGQSTISCLTLSDTSFIKM